MVEKSVLKRLEPIKILIVEDDNLLREEVAEALIPYCKCVLQAQNGKIGLSLFHENHPDVIITDIHLPQMNGLTMVKHVREVNRSIPIIVLTAFDTSDNIGKSINMEVISFLHKPFDIEQLYNALLMASGKLSSAKHLLHLDNSVTYDYRTKNIYKENKLIHLTKSEKKLLEILVENKGYTVSYDAIEKYVWYEKGATPDTIRMYINKLRSKIYYELIENIKGLGYKLNLI